MELKGIRMSVLRAFVAVIAIMSVTVIANSDPVEAKKGNKSFASKSNKGGELRGLDRADYVAGSHGAHGRANARARKNKKRKKNQRIDAWPNVAY